MPFAEEALNEVFVILREWKIRYEFFSFAAAPQICSALHRLALRVMGRRVEGARDRGYLAPF
jgi:hypothetical protein